MPISCIGTYSHTDIPQTFLTYCALETERVFFSPVFLDSKKRQLHKAKKIATSMACTNCIIATSKLKCLRDFVMEIFVLLIT